MPIHIDDLDAADTTTGEPTNAERVLEVFLQHRKQVFKASEIADRVDIHANSSIPFDGEQSSLWR